MVDKPTSRLIELQRDAPNIFIIVGYNIPFKMMLEFKSIFGVSLIFNTIQQKLQPKSYIGNVSIFFGIFFVNFRHYYKLLLEQIFCSTAFYFHSLIRIIGRRFSSQ